MRCLLVPAFLMLLISCEIDYDLTGETTSVLSEPDILMTGVEQMEVQGEQFFLVEAESAEIFYNSGETRFKDLTFEELDPSGEILRKGSAQEMIQYDNDDLFLKGGIELEDLKEDSRILGEEFTWNSEKRLLESTPEGKVQLNWEDDNRLEGLGFSADFQKNELKFSQSVEGVIRGTE